LGKFSKIKMILLLAFIAASLLNFVNFSMLKSKPFREISYMAKSIEGKDNPLGEALKIITSKGSRITVYSIDDGKLTNINDFQERATNSLPTKGSSKAVEYRYGKEKLVVSFVPVTEGGVLLLIYDYKNFKGLEFSLVLETVMLLLCILIFLLLTYRERAKEGVIQTKKLSNEKQLQNALSHELKTPLAAIQGYRDLIFESEDIAKIRYYSEKLQSNLERLNRSIEQILSLNQSSEADRLSNSSSELMELLEGLVLEYQLLSKDKKIKLENNNSKKIENPIIVKLIISNILSNFVKHSSEKGELNIVTTSKEGRISIKFIQSNDTTFSKPNKGLGLEIIKYLSSRYNIQVVSDNNYNYVMTL